MSGAPFAYKTTNISVLGLFAGDAGLQDVLAADDPDRPIIHLDRIDDRADVSRLFVSRNRIYPGGEFPDGLVYGRDARDVEAVSPKEGKYVRAVMPPATPQRLVRTAPRRSANASAQWCDMALCP